MKTKIEWCDITINQIIGCGNNCPYCYAKKLNDRFHFVNEWNIPEYKAKNVFENLPKKPKIIFINSMSDINCWKPSWIIDVLNKIRLYPQHRFLFLTKFPEVYINYDFPDNCWLGVTMTKNWTTSLIKNITEKNNTFYSIEPIQENINLYYYIKSNWVILGAESGNRKGKIIPRKEWILDIVKYCAVINIPLFMKNNLKDIWKGDLIKEFPEELKLNK